MIKLLKLFFKPLYLRYNNLISQLTNLEHTVDYLLTNPNNPVYKSSDNVGFNNQRFRKEIFIDLIKTFKFDAIIETGTWLGNTTGYMQENSNLPIHSCELNLRSHKISQIRLREFNKISLYCSDSRSFLRTISNTIDKKQKLFIYLDAHWYNDLPLEEEIKIIAEQWDDFVIMIDDFKVPHDPGYKFDDYGKNKALTLECFSHVFQKYNLIPLFPTKPSSDDTGSKTGCVILAREGSYSKKLDELDCLRSH